MLFENTRKIFWYFRIFSPQNLGKSGNQSVCTKTDLSCWLSLMLGGNRGLCSQPLGFSHLSVCSLTHSFSSLPLQFLCKESSRPKFIRVVRLSKVTGFILMQFSRQTVPSDLAQASLPNLQQITIIPTQALWIKTSFLWFLVMIREWGCHSWFMKTARWYCGFFMSI